MFTTNRQNSNITARHKRMTDNMNALAVYYLYIMMYDLWQLSCFGIQPLVWAAINCCMYVYAMCHPTQQQQQNMELQ